MHRRSFISALIGAAALDPVLVSSQAPVSMSKPQLCTVTDKELINSALRMLGVLIPGELATPAEYDAAAPVLNQLRATGWNGLAIRYALARELAPEYGVSHRL